MNRLRQKDRVDAACAGPGEDIGQHAQTDLMLVAQILQQFLIGRFAAQIAIGPGMRCPAGACELP